MKIRVMPREAILDLLAPGSVGAEIGVHLGNFSARILKVVQPAKLHLIDPWTVFEDEGHENSWYGTKTVTQSEMDQRHQSVVKRFAAAPEVDVVRDFGAAAAAKFDDGYFDWVYIDGDHSYEGVTADIAAYAPKLKKNGLLLGDDYAMNGWWKRGVIDAFHEALATKEFNIEFKIGNQIALKKLV